MKQCSKEMSGKSSLRKGDLVIVIAGGNKKTRPTKGQVGKILRFIGDGRERVIVEGINLVTRHQRAKGPGQQAARVRKEAPVHISRVMYYVEKIKKGVRLKHSFLSDGTKVRGYKDPETKQFVQVAD